MLIHTKPISKSKFVSAITYALITILTPVVSVATNYSSAFADSITHTEEFNFTVTVNELST
ncbi:hypothetical protein IKE79_00955, partial [Candidatus Saccharibacteria bacterium]|nr:hypothetical protein [Candidatus Saccharibacteria bacterium]